MRQYQLRMTSLIRNSLPRGLTYTQCIDMLINPILSSNNRCWDAPYIVL